MSGIHDRSVSAEDLGTQEEIPTLIDEILGIDSEKAKKRSQFITSDVET